MRIDAAAELLRLEYEKARISALRGRLASGLGRADQELKTTQSRVAWVLDMLGSETRPTQGATGAKLTPKSAEQLVTLALELLAGNAGTSR